jgi:hypothetical protein
MKLYISIFLISLISQLLVAGQSRGQTGTFVASTPCSTGTRPVPGIHKGERGCELIKWKLKFSGTVDNKSSGSYILDCDYGMPKQGTRDFINGGSHLHREGKWTMVKGASSSPAAVIYRLDPDKPAESISFIRLNAYMLHLLDDHGRLMIGNGAWSYTLSKATP